MPLWIKTRRMNSSPVSVTWKKTLLPGLLQCCKLQHWRSPGLFRALQLAMRGRVSNALGFHFRTPNRAARYPGPKDYWHLCPEDKLYVASSSFEDDRVSKILLGSVLGLKGVFQPLSCEWEVYLSIFWEADVDWRFFNLFHRLHLFQYWEAP